MTTADRIIDAMGGTTAVARATETPLSTVHSWRRNGIPRSRLAHLRLVASQLDPAVDIDAMPLHADADSAALLGGSAGKETYVSGGAA